MDDRGSGSDSRAARRAAGSPADARGVLPGAVPPRRGDAEAEGCVSPARIVCSGAPGSAPSDLRRPALPLRRAMASKTKILLSVAPGLVVSSRYWYRRLRGRADPEMRVLESMVRPGTVAVDVGGNLGEDRKSVVWGKRAERRRGGRSRR